MANFFQHVVAGLANGGIYATLALALVLIHRATGILNFAQGEIGMFALLKRERWDHKRFDYSFQLEEIELVLLA